FETLVRLIGAGIVDEGWLLEGGAGQTRGVVVVRHRTACVVGGAQSVVGSRIQIRDRDVIDVVRPEVIPQTVAVGGRRDDAAGADGEVRHQFAFDRQRVLVGGRFLFACIR